MLACASLNIASAMGEPPPREVACGDPSRADTLDPGSVHRPLTLLTPTAPGRLKSQD